MAVRRLRPIDVRVNVRGRGKRKPSLRYVRPLAGLTFSKALDSLLYKGDHELPVAFMSPYYLNGKETNGYSEVVLKPGDTISVTGP